MLNRRVDLSLASFPGRPFLESLMRAEQGIEVPVLGHLTCQQVQLCPQNRGTMKISLAEQLRADHPQLAFRLHANVRVLSRPMIIDVADFDPEHPYWLELREVHRALGARVYTAHAGLRRTATMTQMIDNVRRMADFFDSPVAVEGHYPAKGDPYLMSWWAEWEQVFNAGVPFVVDVSHAQIVARLGGGPRMDLLGEMLASERCLEIHLSGNDGTRDQHRPMTGGEWWWPLLERANPAATLFYEGVAGRAKPMERPAGEECAA
ncbi:hypothetical protein [Geopseudomonas aromaticivorans]